jgi:hypothetical protein
MNCGDQLSLFRKVGGGLVGIMNMALKGKKYILIHPKSFKHCCGAGDGGAVIKLPFGAVAVITNYGSGSGFFYYFIKDLKKFYQKNHWCINPSKNLLKSKKVIFNLFTGAGVGFTAPRNRDRKNDLRLRNTGFKRSFMDLDLVLQKFRT